MTVWRVDVIDPRTGYRMWTERTCSAFWRAVLVVLIVVGSGCTVPALQDNEGARRQVEECVARGGTPQYTFNRYGKVRTFFGCVMP